MIRLVAVIVPIFLLSACSTVEHEDIKNWMRDQSKDMRGRVPPLPQIKPFPAVAYVRFASVYRNFADIEEFSDVIREVKRPPTAREKSS